MQTADRLLIMALLIIAVLVMLNDSEPAKSLPLVMADYQHCVTVHSGPIESRTPQLPYQRQKDVA